jgi:hypothetical protein
MNPSLEELEIVAQVIHKGYISWFIWYLRRASAG